MLLESGNVTIVNEEIIIYISDDEYGSATVKKKVRFKTGSSGRANIN